MKQLAEAAGPIKPNWPEVLSNQVYRKTVWPKLQPLRRMVPMFVTTLHLSLLHTLNGLSGIVQTSMAPAIAWPLIIPIVRYVVTNQIQPATSSFTVP